MRLAQRLTPGVKVPISERALILRVLRALRAQGRDLRASKGAARRYFIISSKGVVQRNVDPVALAQEMGLLESWEQLQRKG
jgi:hypothetical protein